MFCLDVVGEGVCHWWEGAPRTYNIRNRTVFKHSEPQTGIVRDV